MVSSTLDQPILFSYNPDFPSSNLVETPIMQQESSLMLSSSEQNGENLLFCLQENSGDEVAVKYIPPGINLCWRKDYSTPLCLLN